MSFSNLYLQQQEIVELKTSHNTNEKIKQQRTKICMDLNYKTPLGFLKRSSISHHISEISFISLIPQQAIP
jgi:hypothetical protein